MITIHDLKKIAKRSWRNMNPAQKLAILKKVNELEPNSHNRNLMNVAEVDYEKWIKTTSYEKLIKEAICE